MWVSLRFVPGTALLRHPVVTDGGKVAVFATNQEARRNDFVMNDASLARCDYGLMTAYSTSEPAVTAGSRPLTWGNTWAA